MDTSRTKCANVNRRILDIPQTLVAEATCEAYRLSSCAMYARSDWLGNVENSCWQELPYIANSGVIQWFDQQQHFGTWKSKFYTLRASSEYIWSLFSSTSLHAFLSTISRFKARFAWAHVHSFWFWRIDNTVYAYSIDTIALIFTQHAFVPIAWI